MDREVFACLKLEHDDSLIHFATPTDWARYVQSVDGDSLEVRIPRMVSAFGITEILGSQGSSILVVGSPEELTAWARAPMGTWGLLDQAWAVFNLPEWFGPNPAFYCRTWESGPCGFIEEDFQSVAPKYSQYRLDLLDSEQGDFEDRINGQILQRDMALVARRVPVSA
jgi:hypothetical protein